MLSLLSLLFCFLNTTRVSGYAEMALKYLFFLSSFFFFLLLFLSKNDIRSGGEMPGSFLGGCGHG